MRNYATGGFGSAIYHEWNGKDTLVFGVGYDGNPAASGNEKMVITHDGNVGIGITKPGS